MSDRSSLPSMADWQRQWQEMAEAAAKPWQDIAEVFAQPWRELSESMGTSPDVGQLGQQAWDIFTSSFTALAEQQEHIAEAMFDAMRAGAEELRKVMEPIVEQMSSFGRGGTASAPAAATTPTPAAPSTANAAPAKKTAAKKTVTKKTAAKKATAKKTTAKKTTAKKTTKATKK